MNHKKITVKTQNGYSYNIDLSDDETYTDLMNKMTNCVIDLTYGPPTFTFVYKGKIVNASNFNEIENGSFLMCIVSSSPASVSSTESVPSTPVSTSVSSTESVSSTPVPASVSSTESDSSKSPFTISDQSTDQYSYKQIKASLVVFLDFVRNNAQLKELYLNNYNQLVNELVTNPDLDTIIHNILGQSGRIIEAMEKKENIKININGSDGNVSKIDLSQQDEQVIMELIDLGFDPTKAITAYIESGYDKDAAINKLLNS
jgi:hypothetical protein